MSLSIRIRKLGIHRGRGAPRALSKKTASGSRQAQFLRLFLALAMECQNYGSFTAKSIIRLEHEFTHELLPPMFAQPFSSICRDRHHRPRKRSTRFRHHTIRRIAITMMIGNDHGGSGRGHRLRRSAHDLGRNGRNHVDAPNGSHKRLWDTTATRCTARRRNAP